jgi:hypothetical protein
MGGQLRPYTCVYPYRTESESNGGSGTRLQAPDFYYGHAGEVISQPTAGTMLKYLAKAGLTPVPQK